MVKKTIIKEEVIMPPKEISITLFKNVYKLSYGRTGDLIDIELLKNQYSANSYRYLVTSSSSLGIYASFIVDAFATLQVLSPNLVKDLNVKSLFDLDIVHTKSIVSAYTKEVLPWINNWLAYIGSDVDEIEEE